MDVGVFPTFITKSTAGLLLTMLFLQTLIHFPSNFLACKSKATEELNVSAGCYINATLLLIMMTSSNGNIFPHNWPFGRGIHWSPVNSPHKVQWLGALMFSLICAWINAWLKNREAGDLNCHRSHYDIIVLYKKNSSSNSGQMSGTNSKSVYWWLGLIRLSYRSNITPHYISWVSARKT